jgi:hypothetical protein
MVRVGQKNLKFLMGPGWAKKSEIFYGSGVGKKSEIFDGSSSSNANVRFWCSALSNWAT